jgi:hypothetical protein
VKTAFRGYRHCYAIIRYIYILRSELIINIKYSEKQRRMNRRFIISFAVAALLGLSCTQGVPVTPTPVEPVKPVDPAPVEPVKPVDPAPVEPVKPVDPAPVEPVKPVDPAPVEPIGPPVDPPVDPVTPTKTDAEL